MKKKAAPPTVEELLMAVENATDEGAKDGRTTEEWAELWGVSRGRARTAIKAGIMSGKLIAHNVQRECPLRPGWRPVYTVFSVVREFSE